MKTATMPVAISYHEKQKCDCGHFATSDNSYPVWNWDETNTISLCHRCRNLLPLIPAQKLKGISLWKLPEGITMRTDKRLTVYIETIISQHNRAIMNLFERGHREIAEMNFNALPWTEQFLFTKETALNDRVSKEFQVFLFNLLEKSSCQLSITPF